MNLLKKIGAGLKSGLCKLGRAAKRHKVRTVLLVLVLGAAGFFGVRYFSAAQAAGAQATYTFVRTTTLSRGSLDDTVSTSGTVGSANTSTVTYATVSGTGTATPKVKTVNVAVGDTVAAGDVIVTLDSSDIEESIAKEQKNLAKQLTQAQDTYNTALASYNTACQKVTDYQATYDAALAAYQSAQAAYNAAVASVKTYQDAYDYAVTDQQNAGVAANNAQIALEQANAAAAAAPEDTALAEAAAAAAQALADAQQVCADRTATAQTQKDGLDAMKQVCSYDTVEQTYTQTKQTYEQAKSTMEQYQSSRDSGLTQLTKASDSVEDAATSDTLENLQEQLANCSLTAETAGKVTALSASVGSTPNGTIATIQDTADLKISITIEEADINDVAVGMRCTITSDATDGAIQGTLTQIDPVAGQSGSFGAEVTVDGTDTGLLIGMNATVEIIKSSTSDCFQVPIDAVADDEDGQGDYVYRKTGGEGTDMTFEKVYVTTGATNDYYIEVSSDELAEGDVIRSTADLTQGVETTTDASAGFDLSAMFGGMGGSGAAAMPSGGMPSGGMPSGNMSSGGGRPSGGDMPSGGPQG